MSAAGVNSGQGGMNSEDERFEAELEFVQCLAYPEYLVFLAHGPMDDPRFIKYLAYLHEYWTKPEYSCYLKYPQCLFYLKMLQEPEFRSLAKDTDFFRRMYDQQILHWQSRQTGDFVDNRNCFLAKADAVAHFVGKNETK